MPGAASYGGQVKYIDGVDNVLVYGKCGQLIDNDGHQKQPEDREGSGRRAGHGRGWWPVSVITWHGQHSDRGYPDAAAYLHDMWSGRTRCHVLCWYQFFDGTMALQVWATYIMCVAAVERPCSTTAKPWRWRAFAHRSGRVLGLAIPAASKPQQKSLDHQVSRSFFIEGHLVFPGQRQPGVWEGGLEAGESRKDVGSLSERVIH